MKLDLKLVNKLKEEFFEGIDRAAMIWLIF
jgi:hypothetical protein